MTGEVLFARTASIAEEIVRLLREASISVDAALYRFNLPRLAFALEDAMQRGMRLRLVLDRNKYDEARSTRELLSNHRLPFRLSCGRQGKPSKMHHKFAILDGQILLTGSYNWTLESEDENFENLVVLREPAAVREYLREFKELWDKAVEIGQPAQLSFK
jgi:mitochondrial cardiolipin hydrolase